MKNEKLEWRVQTHTLLKEVLEANPSMWIMTKPLNIFRMLLVEVAERAAELNDPKLNILMLRLAMYEADPMNITKLIEAQQARIDDPTPKVPEQPRPIESYIKDGTIVRVLLKHDHIDKYDSNPLHDSSEPFWTIGANQYIDTGIDEWQFAGWSWEQDCFCETAGTPIGWLPLTPES